MKKVLMIMLMVFVAGGLAACSSNSGSSNSASSNSGSTNTSSNSSSETANSSKQKKDIKITFGMTPWTSTVPPTKIAAHILENMGYQVETVKAKAGMVYTAMSTGDVDVFMDSWWPNQKHYVKEYKKSLESIAISYDDAGSGMVVPKYMENINTVKDLKGKEDVFNNKMYGIGPGDPAMSKMEK